MIKRYNAQNSRDMFGSEWNEATGKYNFIVEACGLRKILHLFVLRWDVVE